MLNVMKKSGGCFSLLLLLIVLVISLRWPALTARTVHIDEGMGIRASELVLAGDWHYSPHNGHGPTLFYLGAVVRKVVGVKLAFFRAITAVTFLLGLFILMWFYRRTLGWGGEILILIGLGLSSGGLFFRAYFFL